MNAEENSVPIGPEVGGRRSEVRLTSEFRGKVFLCFAGHQAFLDEEARFARPDMANNSPVRGSDRLDKGKTGLGVFLPARPERTGRGLRIGIPTGEALASYTPVEPRTEESSLDGKETV